MRPDGRRAVRSSAAATRAVDVVRSRPAAVAALLAALLLAVATVRLFGSLPAGVWPYLRDSVKFEYVGWYVSRGNRLYLDAWAVKPPLPFEVTAALALAAGGVVRYHVLALLANAAGAVLAAAAAAGVVRALTDDALGAVVAGVGTFALPFYAFRALIGFKAKYLVVAATLGCLYCAYRERPVAAGAAGAAAVGLWQLAVVVPLVALGRCWQVGGRAAAARALAAALAVGALVCLPVVAWGAVPAMVTEALLTPLLVTEDHALAGRVRHVAAALGPAIPVAALGLVGVAEGLAPGRIRREWPVALLGGWFALGLLAFDFDSAPDLFPWLAVLAVGAGVAVGRHRAPTAAAPAVVRTPRRARLLAALVLALAALAVAPTAGVGVATTDLAAPDTYAVETRLDPDFAGARTYNATEKQYVYWNRVPLPTCRALGAYTQARLVNEVGLAETRPWYEAPCGRFGPAWRAVRSRYGLRDAGHS